MGLQPEKTRVNKMADLFAVKVLINTWALIRIITFHGEGNGHLLEARVLTNNT